MLSAGGAGISGVGVSAAYVGLPALLSGAAGMEAIGMLDGVGATGVVVVVVVVVMPGGNTLCASDCAVGAVGFTIIKPAQAELESTRQVAKQRAENLGVI